MLRTVGSILLVLIVLIVLIQFIRRDEPVRVNEPSAPLAPVAPAPVRDSASVENAVHEPEPSGEWAERLNRGRWTRVLVIGRREGECRVHFPGKPSEFDLWVPRNSVRLLADDEDVRNRGWTAEVNQSGRWRPCQVLKRNGLRYYVHYVGESSSYDEWVTADQLRKLPLADSR